VTSAGTRPRAELHPNTVRVLREAYGIDISAQLPRHIDTLAGQSFDFVITLCDRAREVCPEFLGHPRHIHWSIPDPATVADASADAAFERAAADVDTRVRHLLPVLAHAVTQTQEVSS
jgi:protein-tyrosine-phosphatase